MLNSALVLAAEGKTHNPIIPDISELILGIVAFLILLFILKKYVVPRFEAAYEERAQKIEGGIEKAERAQAEAEEALAKYKAQLQEASLWLMQNGVGNPDAAAAGSRSIAVKSAERSSSSSSVAQRRTSSPAR